MRVWIVNQYAVSPADPGGLRPFALAKELVQKGHEVTLVAGSFNHWTRAETRLKEGEDEKEEFVNGVRFVWIRTPAYPGSTLKRFFSMLTFSRNVQNSGLLAKSADPDVIVGSNPHLFAAHGAMKLAREFGSAFVFEVRDIWPQSLVDLGRMSENHPVILMMKAMERALVRSAEAIVTLPPISSDYYTARGSKPDSVFWVPNGVYLPDLPPVTELPHNEVFTVIFAGIHGVANGLDTVLDAAALLNDADVQNVKFRLLGDGGEKPRLMERAKQMGLTNVEFSDSVPKSQVPQEIAKADAGLLILKKSPVFRWGVSPNKLFDYMGAARPVLYAVEASNNPVADANAGVTVRADDAKDLADAVVKLMQTTWEERREMGLRGRRYVEDNHDLSKLGNVLEAALNHAVKHERR